MKQIVGYTSDSMWLDALRAGLAFMGAQTVGAGVGVFSEIQLKNPVASGVRALVYRMAGFVPTGGDIVFKRHDADLAGDVGAGVNLLIGGAPGALHVRTAQPAASDGTLLSRRASGGGDDSDRFPTWCLELSEGQGILFTTDAVNTKVSAEFFWIELPA